jgi:two-component system response regulator CpxR
MPRAPCTLTRTWPAIACPRCGSLDSRSPLDRWSTQSQFGPILIVEDDDDGRTILGETLTELGYQVRCAHDGRTGVDILKQYETSAVVLDVYLPDVDGVSIARWLLESQPATKLVLISGWVDFGESSGLQNTEIRFLPKPFTISALHTTLQAASAN